MRFLFCFCSFLASLILPYTLNAAPCEFPAFQLFPKIKFYENKGTIYLSPEDSNNLLSFKAMEIYKITQKNSLEIIDEKKIVKDKELTPNYLKIGDSFQIGDTKYTLLEFGIKKEHGQEIQVFIIDGIPKHKVKEFLGYPPHEYSKETLKDPNMAVSKINIAIILGNKLFAGFGGGFAEGIGIPGGIAVYDFPRNRWNVEWSKELIDLYITDIVPISTSTVWFSSKDEQEFFTFPSKIFEYDLEKNILKPLIFSDLDTWELKLWGDFVFIVSPDGFIIHDLITKQSQSHVWDLYINENGAITPRLIKCNEKKCLNKERNKRIFLLYIGSLFGVKNYRDFLKLTNQFLNDATTEKYFWLPEPYVDCGFQIDMPQDFIKYIDVEQLLLRSETRKSPLVWRTLSRLIQQNKQEERYKQIILGASKDPDEWVKRLAFEAINYLGLIRE